MLRELQRVSSEGDFENLVENDGTQVNSELHAEVLERYAALDEAAYNGFVNPVLTPVMQDGKIADITVAPPESFVEQMLYYADNYSFLPTENWGTSEARPGPEFHDIVLVQHLAEI